MSEPPFLVALRVLGRIGLGLEPSPADKSVLRKTVPQSERGFPVAEIGYLILKRELQSELSGAVRKSETVTLGYPVEPVADGFLG